MNARRLPSVVSASLLGLALTAGGVSLADTAEAAAVAAPAISSNDIPTPSDAGDTKAGPAKSDPTSGTKATPKHKRAGRSHTRTHRVGGTHRSGKSQRLGKSHRAGKTHRAGHKQLPAGNTPVGGTSAPQAG